MLEKTPGTFNVLLIEKDPKQTEVYSGLVRAVAPCDVDVLSRIPEPSEWTARKPYHLVIIDWAGGLDVLEQIKRISPETAVILMSDTATVEQAVAAIRLGAEDYFQKPFKVEAFQLAVKRGLDRKAVLGTNAGASSFLNLLNACQMISSSLEQKNIFHTIQSYFSRELKAGYSAIYTLRDGRNGGVERVDDGSAAAGVAGENRTMEEILRIAIEAANPLPAMVEQNEVYRFTERGHLTPAMFVFRFQCAGPQDYFCVVLSPEQPASMDAFEARLRMLKAQIEVTGKNIEQYLGVQTLVYVDDATGLYNTRYLNNILEREIAQAQASGKSFAVLFLDADKFKSVNDLHGHLIGTKLLNELGSELKKFVRGTDTVFRYGGDEFIAVLSSCDLPTAKSVAERIRQSVESHEFLKSEGKNLRFTVSIGVALFPIHARSKKEIIDAADRAMYDAKKTSRNSVTVAPLVAPVAEPAVAPSRRKKNG